MNTDLFLSISYEAGISLITYFAKGGRKVGSSRTRIG